MKEITVDKNADGRRLDKFLMRYLPGAPGALIYAQLRKKNITLNDTKANGHETLKQGDRIRCFFSDETWEKFRQEALADEVPVHTAWPEVPILWEDKDILIAVKPAGLLSQKAAKNDRSLCEWLTEYLLTKGETDASRLAQFKPAPCHRLDRNTSGIVVCAKTLAAARSVSACIKERRLEKYYLALVHGTVEKAGVARGSFSRDADHNKTTIAEANDLEEEVITAYAPIMNYEYPRGPGMAVRKPFTLLMARLVTGKTHQLRAQFSAMGHPIIGDRKYGSFHTADDKKVFEAPAQLLHASAVFFPEDPALPEGLSGKHFIDLPLSGAWARYTTELADADINKALKAIHGVYGS